MATAEISTASPVLPTDAPRGATRLLSVDVLRGFDMFWIIGADALVRAVDRAYDNAFTRFLAAQVTHAKWEGFRFYDLIFPLFLFVVGVSLVFSLDKALQTEGRARVLGRVFRRAVILYLLGILYHGGVSNADGVQLSGVLQRIALCYPFAAILYCFLRSRSLAVVSIALLIGYWALLTFVPFPDLQLNLFYLIVDVWKMQRWCVPFVWIGMNAITVYLAANLLSFSRVAQRIVGGDVEQFLNTQVAAGAGGVFVALVSLGLALLFVWFLHGRRIFLRV